MRTQYLLHAAPLRDSNDWVAFCYIAPLSLNLTVDLTICRGVKMRSLRCFCSRARYATDTGLG